MNATELRDLLRVAPFRPIKLDIGRGRTATIQDPALVLLSESKVVFADAVHEGITSGLTTVDLPKVRKYQIVE
jgi:hypothetical protein